MLSIRALVSEEGSQCFFLLLIGTIYIGVIQYFVTLQTKYLISN